MIITDNEKYDAMIIADNNKYDKLSQRAPRPVQGARWNSAHKCRSADDKMMKIVIMIK